MKLKKILVAFLSCSFLFACGEGGNNHSSDSESIFSSNENSSEEVKKYEKIERNTSNTLYKISSNRGNIKLNSLGEQKILVVPIVIKGYEELATEEILNQINVTFFGDKEDNLGYESVSSFYNKSSYERLKISGKVTDFYNPELSFSEIYALKDDEYNDMGLFKLSDMVASWYKSTYDDIQDFDQNNDGFIDAMWFVYIGPNHSNNDNVEVYSLQWAFSFYNNENISKGNVDSPLAMSFSWASYEFMYDGYGKDMVDSHVFIHETGHLLGLEDYYSTSTTNMAPIGKVDMMDDDLGDHLPYSKFALGWVEPYIIDGAGEITLRSFTETGDCLLFKTENYNNTPFDEYIMIDFVTPTGLNEQDYLEGYCGKYGYKEKGVRVTYINSLAINEDLEFTDDINEMFALKFDNSPTLMDGVYNPQTGMYYLLTTLIPKDCGSSNNGLFKRDFHADSSHLFKENDEFNLVKWSQYRNVMPNISNKYVKKNAGFFKYNVVVSSIDETSCTIRIENV